MQEAAIPSVQGRRWQTTWQVRLSRRQASLNRVQSIMRRCHCAFGFGAILDPGETP
jgi:hypothetical protein